MKSTKFLIALACLFAFAIQVSAQDKTPKIVWKNLQAKYERFEDIKPVIVNVTNQPIYFNCRFPAFADNYFGIRLTKRIGVDSWQWNNWICGTISKDEEKKQKKEEKRIEELKRKGKYVPAGCKLNPNEEFTFSFDQKTWNSIINGDGITYQPYKFGEFRFEFPFELIEDSAISYSPEFSIRSEEDTK